MISGTGIAAHTLARQLKLTFPDLSVLMLESAGEPQSESHPRNAHAPSRRGHGRGGATLATRYPLPPSGVAAAPTTICGSSLRAFYDLPRFLGVRWRLAPPGR